MSMEIDIFAETDYGKIALRKIAPTDPNFRLYEAGWLGKHGKSDVMEVKGAVFRPLKTGPYKGKLGVRVQGTDEMAYVTADELRRFKDNLADGYLSGVANSTPEGGEIHLHYATVEQMEKAFALIVGQIDYINHGKEK